MWDPSRRLTKIQNSLLQLWLPSDPRIDSSTSTYAIEVALCHSLKCSYRRSPWRSSTSLRSASPFVYFSGYARVFLATGFSPPFKILFLILRILPEISKILFLVVYLC